MSREPTGLIKPERIHQFVLLDTSPQLIANITRSTLWTVGIGIVLFLIVLILGMKIKILWIALPLCLYLIGQLFVYTNHIRATKDQRVYFDTNTYDVLIDYVKGPPLSFNLQRDVIRVSEVRSVQKNRDTIFGYYRIHTSRGIVVLPYILEQSERVWNQHFFEYLNTNYKIEIESKLFPII